MNDVNVEVNGGEEVFESALSSILIDSIGDVMGVIALFVIIVAGVRLFRATNAPGAKYIYYSIVLTVIGFIIPLLAYSIYGEDGYWVFDVALNIYAGLVSIIGAYGFWLLTSYVIEINANK